MTALPTNISFGKVRGRFGSPILTAGDADGLPDFQPLTGLEVIFTPKPDIILNLGASPVPVTFLTESITCTLDDDGYLVGPDGREGINLIATDDADLAPTGWTYKVSFGGNLATYKRLATFDISVPADSTRWLTAIAPVPSSSGSSTLDEVQAAVLQMGVSVGQAQGYANSAAASAAAAATSANSFLTIAARPTTGQVLVATGTSTGKWSKPAAIPVSAFGADPTGATYSDSAVAAAYAAMGSVGQLEFGAGTYKFSGALPTFGAGQGVKGPGSGACVLKPFGTGDFLRVYQSSFDSSLRGGIFEGFTIDGANAGTGSVGIHYGDMTSGRMRDINVKGFTTAGAIGAFFHNIVGWSERLNIDISVGNCTRNFVFDGSNDVVSAASFMYGSFRLKAYINPGQEGFTLQNGASFIGATHEWTWNTTPGTAAHTGKVVRIGTTTETLASSFYRCSLNWVGESTGSGTFGHQTIVMQGNASVAECYGLIKFHGNTHATGVNNGNFWFGGAIYVDNAFGKSGNRTAQTNIGGVVGKLGLISSGTILLDSGNVFKTQLASGANTLAFDSAVKTTYANSGMANVYDLIVQQPASGAAGTVTWPGTVTWIDGSTPILSTVNGAVDTFRIVTFDHQTMYGQALPVKTLASGAVIGHVAGGMTLKDVASAPATPSTGSAIYPVNGALKVKSAGGLAYVLAPLTKLNAQAGTTYTLAATDEGKTLDFTGASDATLTIPPNSSVALPIGTCIPVVQSGSGRVTVVGGVAVNLYVKGGGVAKTSARYGVLYLVQRSTDNWVIAGDVASPTISGRVVTATTTMNDYDQTVVFNSASTVSQALPAATSVTPFKQFQLNNINTGTVTLTDTISGTANRTLAQWATLTVFSTGSVWLLA